MDYQKLIFAAVVRQRAAELRKMEESRYDDEHCDGLQDQEARSALATWREGHPLASYFPDAIAQIKEAADIIETLSAA